VCTPACSSPRDRSCSAGNSPAQGPPLAGQLPLTLADPGWPSKEFLIRRERYSGIVHTAFAAAQQIRCLRPRNSNRRSTFALSTTGGTVAELRIMPQEKTRPTVLCPACKTRMNIRQIATASFTADEFVYHCPMCDTETKQRLRGHQLSPPQAPKTPYWQWRSFKHAAG
jgi:hypothetical protein